MRLSPIPPLLLPMLPVLGSSSIASCLYADNTPVSLPSLTPPLTSRPPTRLPPQCPLCIANVTRPGRARAPHEPTHLTVLSSAHRKSTLQAQDPDSLSASPFLSHQTPSTSKLYLLPSILRLPLLCPWPPPHSSPLSSCLAHHSSSFLLLTGCVPLAGTW